MQHGRRKKNYCLLVLLGYALSVAAQSVPGEIIVQLSGNEETANVHLPEGLTPQKVLSRHANIHLWSYDTLQLTANSAIQLARRHAPVLLAQANHQLHYRDTLPTDPLFPQQWQWQNTSSQNSLPDADVDAELAWAMPMHAPSTVYGDTIVVAVIDDGVQANHPDLLANLWQNHHEIPNNHVDDDQNGYVDDYRGWNATLGTDHIHQGHHGTRVAGMLGAAWHNGTGGTGIAPQVKMMIVAGGSQTEAAAVAAYDYVLNQRLRYNETQGEQGAFVVATNTSWGVNGLDPDEAPVWCQFYDLLGEAGILNCAATANASWNIDEMGDMPTACSSPYLLTATASNRMDERTGAYGPLSVDLAAPGQDVLTTQPGSGYGWSSGTSFASPVAAGAVALLYSSDCPDIAALALTDPAAAALEAKTILLHNTDPLPGMEGQTVTGGRLNVHRALQELTLHCSSCPPVASIAVSPTGNQQLVVTWQTSGSGQPALLRWRAEGNTSWDSITNVGTPQTLDQLSPCTHYEVQVLRQCPDNTASTGQTVTAVTEGCCLPPPIINISSLNHSEAILDWEATETNPAFHISLQDETGWVFSTTQHSNSIQLSGLSPCTAYEAYIAIACQSGNSDSTTLRFVTKGCGSCTDFDYCPSYGGTSGTEWIDGFSFGGHYYFSGLNEGTPLFPVPEFAAIKGQPVPVSVYPGFQHLAFPEYVRIWIDLNQDGQFDTGAELLLDTLLLPGNDGLHASLFIPERTLPGNTRMRVSLKWAGFGNMRPTPCEPTIHFGEVEDYCIEILEPSILNTAPVPANEADALQIWPNPFSTALQLRWSGARRSALVQLMSIDGKLHFEQNIELHPGQPVFLTPPQPLPPGWYLLQARMADEVFRKRLVHR